MKELSVRLVEVNKAGEHDNPHALELENLVKDLVGAAAAAGIVFLSSAAGAVCLCAGSV